jgi:hypothetical protein
MPHAWVCAASVSGREAGALRANLHVCRTDAAALNLLVNLLGGRQERLHHAGGEPLGLCACKRCTHAHTCSTFSAVLAEHSMKMSPFAFANSAPCCVVTCTQRADASGRAHSQGTTRGPAPNLAVSLLIALVAARTAGGARASGPRGAAGRSPPDKNHDHIGAGLLPRLLKPSLQVVERLAPAGRAAVTRGSPSRLRRTW